MAEEKIYCGSLIPYERRGNFLKCNCTNCVAGKKTEQFFNTVYNINGLTSGTTKCRLCTEVEKNKDIIDLANKIWLDCQSNAEKINRGAITTIRTGSFVLLDTQREVDECKKFAGMILQSNIGDFEFKGVAAKFYGVKAGIFTTSKSEDIFAVLKCRYCENILVSSSAIKGITSTCPICSSIRTEHVQKREANENARMQKRVETASKKMLPHIRGWRERAKEGSTLAKQIEAVEKSNPGYTCLDANTNGGVVYSLICKSCGTEYRVARKDKKLGECTFCKSKGVHEYGKFLQDFTNSVKNGLCVVSQNKAEFTCVVECIYCKRTCTIPLYDFLEGRYFCDCDGLNKQFSDCFCDNCGSLLPDIKAVAFFNSKADLICPICKENVRDVYAVESSSCDYKSSLLRKIRSAEKDLGADSQRKVRFNLNNDVLLIEKDQVYKGNTDGLAYYRCICKEHNKSLLLSEEEVANYGGSTLGHKYCTDARQHTVPYPDPTKVKL